MNRAYYLAPRGVQIIVMSSVRLICPSVCLPVCVCPLAQLAKIHELLCILLMTSSGVVAIYYVLPVLWMTSYCYI